MGVLPNQKKVFFSDTDSADENIITESDSDSGHEVLQLQREVRRPPPRTLLSPATTRKFCGHKLSLKKGQRSRRRYENERILFSSVEMDSEDPPEGWDIATESRSHFRELLSDTNRSLLDRFTSTFDDFSLNENSNESKTKFVDTTNPEEAYLSIHANVRAAIKKHLPWGMLEGLDKEIFDFFESDPSAKYISQNLSSYERMLAHACSMYYQLRSQSFDVNGIRTLKIENPGTFKPVDPSLSTYLKQRHNVSV